MKLAPGDPVQMMIDPNITASDLIQLKKNLGLDLPLWQQYFIWLKNILMGNFGTSLVTSRPVLEMILERLPATLLLMIASFGVTLVIAIPLGIKSAQSQNSLTDHSITFLSFISMSIPSFWLALMAMLFFSLWMGLVPSSGMYDLETSVWLRPLDILWHLILPVLVLTIGELAGYIRYLRASMLGVLKQNYIRTAKAKGLDEKTIIQKHALKNALLPLITILGLSLPGLFGGAFIIEKIFSWPGMGMLGVNAIFARDYPLIMGLILFSSFLILIGNLLADLAYSWPPYGV
jgi:peptide/nickel transport system permease protein